MHHHPGDARRTDADHDGERGEQAGHEFARVVQEVQALAQRTHHLRRTERVRVSAGQSSKAREEHRSTGAQ